MAKETNQLLKELSFSISNSMPDNLRGKFPLDHVIWEFLDDANCIILSLIQDKILTKRLILQTISIFDQYVDLMCHYLSNRDQIKLAMYWSFILNYINDKCLEEEKFEACSNIKKFKELYFIVASTPNE